MAETISTGQIKDLESMRPQYEAEKKRGATTDSFEVWSKAHFKSVKKEYQNITGRTPTDQEVLDIASKYGNINEAKGYITQQKVSQIPEQKTLEAMYQQELASGRAKGQSFEYWSKAHLQGIKNEYKRITGKDLNDSQAAYYGSTYGDINDIKMKFASDAVSQVYDEEFGRVVDPSGFQTYVQGILNGSSMSDVRSAVRNSKEWMYEVGIPTAYWDKLGREPDADGLAHYKEMYDKGLLGGNNEDAFKYLKNEFENSQEYKDKGGKEGEMARDLENAINFPDEFPEFEWTEERQAEAMAFAEAYYGPYYAQLIKEITDFAVVSEARAQEDYQTNLDSVTATLNDYVSKSDEEKQRIEEDYTLRMFQEAEDLGLDKEKIAEDRVRNLENYGLKTDSILLRYNKLIPEIIEKWANRGMTFSGKRVKEELYYKQQKQMEELQANRTYERALADLDRSEKMAELDYARTLERLETARGRNIADIERQKSITQRKYGETTARLKTALTRSQEDIERERRLKERATTWEKQEQLTSGTYGVETERARREEQYRTDVWDYYYNPEIYGRKSASDVTGYKKPIYRNLGYL